MFIKKSWNYLLGLKYLYYAIEIDKNYFFNFRIQKFNNFIKMSIKKIYARSIYDSRGNPTVEVDLWTDKGNLNFKSLRLGFEKIFKIKF